MSKAQKLRKWTQVYPQGSKTGDEEQKFFIALARNAKYEWRSVAAIVKETGLSKERVEEIIAKYEKIGMVFNNPKNEEQWGYWERVPDMVPNAPPSLTKADQNDRIDKVLHNMASPTSTFTKGKGKPSKKLRQMTPDMVLQDACDKDLVAGLIADLPVRVVTVGTKDKPASLADIQLAAASVKPFSSEKPISYF